MLPAVPAARILLNALSVTDGGGRTYARNLLRELAADPRGFEFAVLCAAQRLPELEADGVPCLPVRLPAGRTGTALRVAWEELALPLRSRRFDLLYCIADLVPVLTSIPTVVALRNLNIYDRRFFRDARVLTLERLVRLGVGRARRVVFPTQAAADLVRQRIPIPEERVRIVPHGIDPAAFGAAPPPPAGAPYLFLPAAVEPHKNVQALIECLPLVSDARLEAWIAGSTSTHPPYAAQMRVLAEQRGVAQRVRFLGPVPYQEILGLHRGAFALVFPSFLESFGHPLLEAMLAGTPVVAADIPALREVAGDAALYFDPHRPADLARAVEQLGREPEATRARVARGRARAAEFSWARSVDRLCAVFEEAL
jgi:glycosyltransferase involved in cell wall biosynthesis